MLDAPREAARVRRLRRDLFGPTRPLEGRLFGESRRALGHLSGLWEAVAAVGLGVGLCATVVSGWLVVEWAGASFAGDLVGAAMILGAAAACARLSQFSR